MKASCFDDFADEYDATFGRKGESFFHKKILPYMPSLAECILDAGCGSGSVALQISKQGRFVVGIDISSEMINLAKKNLAGSQITNVAFVIADIEHLPFENRSFDFVLSNFTLHHTGIEKSLPGLTKLVRENGVLLVRDLVIKNPGRQDKPLWHILLSLYQIPRLLRTKGLRRTARLMSIELNPSWIQHKTRQRLLSPVQFESHFQCFLPGCSFPEGPIGVALWKATGETE